MGDQPQDAPSLALDDEVVNSAVGHNLILVGKILSPKPLRKQGVLHMINVTWKMKNGFTASCLGENMYGFTFKADEDLNRVYDMASWSIMGHMIVLCRWESLSP
ncbi:hypothetical protein Vadar_022673 [Vaccinium darrowii]|uniref:Uncharacterized protein n=1 Tax=Vaccinium darrowii TaxID=229202 RepID=A0ACB7XC65_9ERIC|nr:hypothetical protein Vadar_022673 [Vaccinium darrowii]